MKKSVKTNSRNDYSIYNEVMSIKASKRDWNYIVLVKNGDFFESYEEDADQVSGICKVGQFTRKDCLLNIAGFHKDILPIYLARIIRAGWKVVILDK